MRHRPAHFSHLFASSGYASAYYCYLVSDPRVVDTGEERFSTCLTPPSPLHQYAEVLDADAFAAFKEAGSCFDKDTAARLRKYVYASGNTREPGAAYKAFRGRDPVIEPMLLKKGLIALAE